MKKTRVTLWASTESLYITEHDSVNQSKKQYNRTPKLEGEIFLCLPMYQTTKLSSSKMMNITTGTDLIWEKTLKTLSKYYNCPSIASVADAPAIIHHE